MRLKVASVLNASPANREKFFSEIRQIKQKRNHLDNDLKFRNILLAENWAKLSPTRREEKLQKRLIQSEIAQ
jgi:hypothetical protein